MSGLFLVSSVMLVGWAVAACVIAVRGGWDA